jgi:hypothetical protein
MPSAATEERFDVVVVGAGKLSGFVDASRGRLSREIYETIELTSLG